LLLVVIDISPLIGGATRDYGFLSTAALFTPGQAGAMWVPPQFQLLIKLLYSNRCSLFVVRY
jgi:hypothetical protein